MARRSLCMARQLLKVFSFFFLIFIIFSSCLDKANVNEKKTENIWIDRNLDDNPLKLIKKVEYNVTGYRYKEPENLKFKVLKFIYKIFGIKPHWMALKGEKISEIHEIYIVEKTKIGYVITGEVNGRILKPSEEYFEGKKIFVYNSKGRLIRAEFERNGYKETIEDENKLRKYELLASPFFSYWMLNLHENFKLREQDVVIEVIGIENYMNREVFKVKIKSENLEKILLIDKETKLLLKAEYILEWPGVKYNMVIDKVVVMK